MQDGLLRDDFAKPEPPSLNRWSHKDTAISEGKGHPEAASRRAYNERPLRTEQHLNACQQQSGRLRWIAGCLEGAVFCSQITEGIYGRVFRGIVQESGQEALTLAQVSEILE